MDMLDAMLDATLAGGCAGRRFRSRCRNSCDGKKTDVEGMRWISICLDQMRISETQTFVTVSCQIASLANALASHSLFHMKTASTTK